MGSVFKEKEKIVYVNESPIINNGEFVEVTGLIKGKVYTVKKSYKGIKFITLEENPNGLNFVYPMEIFQKASIADVFMNRIKQLAKCEK